mmetsp:Transcript_9431/g.22344  ORF Transcript_9431/g.22344 Transcript_9431/m.22344 type:complete len:227 (-) Transcript_9431:308-988(-)
MACNVRERNGYGIVTTQYSITSIGRNFEGGHAAKREKAEAAKIQREADYAMTQLKLVHPSRSELYMQTFYPETTKSLQGGKQLRQKTPQHLKDVSFPPPGISDPLPRGPVNEGVTYAPPPNYAGVPFRHKTHNVDMSHIKREHEWNYKRRAQNYNSGRQATVKHIITGEINNIDKSQQNLFPSKATHQQLLVLEKKDIAPNANAPPPMPIRHKKWLGPARGWEGAP